MSKRSTVKRSRGQGNKLLGTKDLVLYRKTQLRVEEERRKQRSLAVAKKFEEGISILTAPEDQEGKKRIPREKFLESLTYDPEEIMTEDGYTQDEITKIKKSLSKMASAPGILVGRECPGRDQCNFRNKCEWARAEKEPVGKSCPVEQFLFTEFLIRYMNDLQVDPTNAGEMAYINELAEIEILLMRANNALSKPDNVDLVIDTIQSVAGQLVTVKEVSPHLVAKTDLSKRRERILKLMVGDRQEKYKAQAALKIKDKEDPTIKQAKKASQIIEAKLKQEIKESEEKDILTPEDIINNPNLMNDDDKNTDK